MEPSENLKEVEQLYSSVCKAMKQYSTADTSVPSMEFFLITVKKFNALVSGHKLLLTAIGKL